MNQSIMMARPRHQMNPKRDVLKLKYRKVGRKPGAFRTPMRKQHRLTPPYMRRKNMVMIGVMKSMFPAIVKRLAMNQVSTIARWGLAVGVSGVNQRRWGRQPSSAMAASIRDAPVRHWRAAPSELIMMPACTTSLCGNAMSATTSLFSRSTSLDSVLLSRLTKRKYSPVVAKMAEMVPVGMLWDGFRSTADRFDPAMIPVKEGKSSPSREKKVGVRPVSGSAEKFGAKFSSYMFRCRYMSSPVHSSMVNSNRPMMMDSMLMTTMVRKMGAVRATKRLPTKTTRASWLIMHRDMIWTSYRKSFWTPKPIWKASTAPRTYMDAATVVPK
mmetsp:Transcript_47375/g.92415  ORF Transcript_47375/g.92415 Transcript_47375/m.92415 type:complete len:327 (-) Transcript_47375:858-1838(-)